MNENLINDLVLLSLGKEIPVDRIADYIFEHYGITVKKNDVERIAKSIRTDEDLNYTVSLMKLKKDVDLVRLETVIYLLGQGNLFVEVAAQLGLKEEDVHHLVSQLNSKSSLLYNASLYQQLTMQERDLNHMDRTLLFARYKALEDKYHCDIHDLSNRIEVQRYELDKRYRLLVQEYIQSGLQLPDQYFETKYHLNISTLRSLFNSKEKLLKYVSPDEADKILEHRSMRMNDNRHIYQKSLNVLSTLPYYNDEKMQLIGKNISFWIQIITNFRLSLNDFAQLIGYTDVNNLYEALLYMTGGRSSIQKGALQYVFTTYSATNLEHYRAAVHFINSYNALRKQGKKEEASQMLQGLYQVDQDFTTLVRKKRGGKLENDDEKLVVLKYKLKYAVPWTMLPFSKANILDLRAPLADDLMSELGFVEAFANGSPSRI